MLIKKLTIEGFRGFSEKTIINFSMPDNITPGSGLTVLVGPNNSGKSTIIEAVHLLSSNKMIIPKKSRNMLNDGKVKIEIEDELNNVISISSTDNGGSFVERKYNDMIQEKGFVQNMDTFILSSKRGFPSTFSSNGYISRDSYKGNVGMSSEYRPDSNYSNMNFGSRLMNIYKNKELFEECLKKVLYPLPKWTIESLNENTSYLEFTFGNIKHDSSGSGDGFINIFNIVDALYDSKEKNVILIDEPEISLHPDLQRKLFNLLVEYSKDKQIIISTHSPYFVDWSLFSNKSKIIRINKENNITRIYELSKENKEIIAGILSDYQKPHILSLNANEVFFLNDNIILTEGQDDVICYKGLFKKYNFETYASFFGWGAGGAKNVKNILDILKNLGYKKVFTIFDNDEKDNITSLMYEFPNYYFFAIAADDVRNKSQDKRAENLVKKINDMSIDLKIKNDIINIINDKFKSKKGLVRDMLNFDINPEYEESILNLLCELKKYFNDTKAICENVDKNNNLNESIVNGHNGKKKCINEKLKQENINNQEKVNELLDEWLKSNDLHKYINDKYRKFEFYSGDGGVISCKCIKNGIYYIIINQEQYITKDYGISINFYIIVDINKNIVKLNKKHICKNTLPISKIEKIIDIILLNILK